MRHLRFPRLTPKAVRDDPSLWELIELIMRRDPLIRRSAFHLREAQRALKRTTTTSNDEYQVFWSGYLWAEEEHNARLVLIAITIARWAFFEGVRSASERRR